MAKIRLYTQSINPFTAKVELGLALKRLDYEREVSNDPEDAKRWSPVTHELPVIQIDNQLIHDSGIILETLDKLFPEPPLLARDPKTARAQLRLAEWCDSSFLFYWNRWREARFPQPGDEQPAEDATLLGKLREGINRAFSQDGMTRRELREAEVINGLAGRLSDLSAFLGQRPFFYADEPSVADVAVYGMLRILHDGPMTGAHDLIIERPELLAYMERMEKQTAPGLPHPPLDAPGGESPPPASALP
jgi:glutathione S-transferase